MTNSFRQKFSFEDRLRESTKVMNKYENRIPVVVTKSKYSKLEEIDKNKYLVPSDLTIGQFLSILRKRLKLLPSQSIFVYVDDNKLPPTSSTIMTIYKDGKDKDGFLYLTYCEENTFGN